MKSEYINDIGNLITYHLKMLHYIGVLYAQLEQYIFDLVIKQGSHDVEQNSLGSSEFTSA